MKFFSHIGTELLDHLCDVAEQAKTIATDSKFENKDLVFYAGLFHDIGKLNPYYQELFRKLKEMSWPDLSDEAKNYESQLAESYDHCHAPYSRWIAEEVLWKHFDDKDKLRKVLMMIYCHHGNMRNNPGTWGGNHKQQTKSGLSKNWEQFKNDSRTRESFGSFDLSLDIREDANIKDNSKLQVEGKDGCLEYVELGFLHSCLLQADRGSLQGREEKNNTKTDVDNWKNEDLKICTQRLKDDPGSSGINNNAKSKLNRYKDYFQNLVAEEIKKNPITAKNPIKIINAPTGIGKTKAFLDMTKEIDVDRIFYFSPLLALTNDFEKKMKLAVCGENEQERMKEWSKILTYNHTYSGMLDEKGKDRRYENNDKVWNFNQESFNERFVITTMHRFLMTIYSPKSSDKLKMASFRNALLIIDEVQTIPKFLLPNLIQIFKIMGEKMGTRIILVSATIPEQLSGPPKIAMDRHDVKGYLSQMKRNIVYENDFDISSAKKFGRKLIMLNTRRMAKNIFNEIRNNETQDELYYVSSGIIKKKQEEIIEGFEDNQNFTLVSTQVMEAGVDISFSDIWRQMAPLDNIVQILGRLNREGVYESSTLHVFDSKDSTPYSQLEYEVSQDYLHKIDSVEDLYDKLDDYYYTVSTRDQTLKDDQDEFVGYVNELDFKLVWQKISRYISNNHYDSVYVPNREDWKKTYEDLLSDRKNLIKKHAKIQAVLPISVYDRKVRNCLDEKLFEKKIYYPKKDMIDELYDEIIGLDKWIKIE